MRVVDHRECERPLACARVVEPRAARRESGREQCTGTKPEKFTA